MVDNPNDLAARVKSERSLTIADICNSAVSRDGADISVTAMEHAVGLFLKETGYNLFAGFSASAGELLKVIPEELPSQFSQSTKVDYS